MAAPSKCCSLDSLPTIRLKTFIDVLSPPVTAIINISRNNGDFPTALKYGFVNPAFKKLIFYFEVFKNYRLLLHITCITFQSKTIERIVSMQLNEYICVNNLLAKMQSAYHANYSIEAAICLC